MSRIPWCVVLTMIKDQGRSKKKGTSDNEEGEVIEDEEDELNFLGLG